MQESQPIHHLNVCILLIYYMFILEPQQQAPACDCGIPCAVRISGKDNENKGRPFFTCSKKVCKMFKWADQNSVNKGLASVPCVKNIKNPDERQAAFRSAQVPFYHDCELTEKNLGYGGSAKTWLLKLNDREKSSSYSRDDVWIISDVPDFIARGGDDGHVVIARSTFHGPSSNGTLQVSVTYGNAKRLSSDNLYAIRGPNCSSYFEMLENIDALDADKLPLINELLGEPKKKSMSWKIQLSHEEVQEQLESFTAKYTLNEDQKKYLNNVVNMLECWNFVQIGS